LKDGGGAAHFPPEDDTAFVFEGGNTMRNKALAVRSILKVTENRAKRRQVSGHSRFSRGRIENENLTLQPGLARPPQVEHAPAAAKRLLSWKEVAGYLKCNIRSVQRWERGEGLPGHRHIHQKGSTVYAYSNELDAWLWNRRPLESSRPAAPKIPTVETRLYLQEQEAYRCGS
jgi:hypothetical protein